ncbi:MAG: arginine--tRNA ligase, partial [Methanosarcinales archaeon]
KEKVIIEHTSANPNGPLHVGHIRNSVIGDTLARIFKKAGYDVETQYYVNDMGRQIAIVVWGLDNFEFDESKKSDHAIADIYIKANRVLEENPDKKNEIDTLMQKYENGDPKTIEKFENAVNLAISGIKTTLEKMNIHHDRYIWESEFVRSGFIKEVVENIKSKGKIQIENNALIVLLEGFEKGLVIQRGDGTSLYSTRDIAYHVWKANQCHKMINILGADHKLISSQLKAVLKIINCTQPEIVIFEFVGLPSGSMSTRRGKFISADELLEEVEKQAFLEVDSRRPDMDLDFKKKVANSVGIGAVRYDIVKVSADKATTFDWKNALDFEKRGAPFIQYAHARACNILKKANQNIESLEFDPNLLILSQEIDLIKKLSKFSYVINLSAKELKPHLFATYARELAELFNQFYRYVPVISAEDIRTSKARLALVNCSRIVLANTLDALGIDAPEEI